MNKELVLTTDLLFDQVSHDLVNGSWTFAFGKESFRVSGLWRILENKLIKHVSLDHGQKFGLVEAIDLAKVANELLKNRRLKTIRIKPNSSDLELILDSDLEIEIFIASSGYETYEFTHDSKRYVGQGAGEIVIF